MRRILLILIVVSACHGKRAGKDYFGAQVSPPGLLAQIRPGMTLAQVKTIAPDAKDDRGKGLLLAKPASNVKLYAVLEHDIVDYTYVDLDGEDCIALLTQAWGPPDKEPDRGDHRNTAWRSTATGWRAAVSKVPPSCRIQFHPHLPVDGMFTKPIVPPGAFAKVTPRMKLADVKTMTHLAALTDEPTQVLIHTLAYDGVTEDVGVVDGRLFDLDYTVPASARAAMDKAWGPAKLQGDRALWFDATSGWSAIVRAIAGAPAALDLEYQAYEPLSAELDLLETISKSSSVADVFTSHPELDTSASNNQLQAFYVPCNELTDPGFRSEKREAVGLFSAHDGVRAVLMSLDPAREAEIVELLTQRWGPPVKHVDAADQIEYRFAEHGVLMRLGSSLGIQVGSDA